ncbi:MAG: hypothetical protein ABW001_05755 [Mycobacterium sp.]
MDRTLGNSRARVLNESDKAEHQPDPMAPGRDEDELPSDGGTAAAGGWDPHPDTGAYTLGRA